METLRSTKSRAEAFEELSKLARDFEDIAIALTPRCDAELLGALVGIAEDIDRLTLKFPHGDTPVFTH